MNTENILVILIAMSMIACNQQNIPDEKCGTHNTPTETEGNLLTAGEWVCYHSEEATVESLTFLHDSILIYENKPDSNSPIHSTWGGTHKELHYHASADSLRISHTPNSTAEEFGYTTAYTIADDTLTLDKFSDDGLRFRKVKLQKKKL